MTREPRTQHDYTDRQTEAARRVLVDLGQVLASFFADSIVVVGGWVPDLLLPDAEEPHVGSIDVDLALDADKFREGRYAEIVKSMLATGRYEKTDQQFKLRATVDLGDGGPALEVDVDFLKPLEKKRRKRGGVGPTTHWSPPPPAASRMRTLYAAPKRRRVGRGTTSGSGAPPGLVGPRAPVVLTAAITKGRKCFGAASISRAISSLVR